MAHTTRPTDLRTDANGNAIVYDVYVRPRTGGTWTKDHGEYTTETGAQRVCDRLNEEQPHMEYKPRRRRGMKASLYLNVVL